MEKTFKESTKKSILIKIDELKDKVANGNLTTEQLMKIQNNIDKSLKMIKIIILIYFISIIFLLSMNSIYGDLETKDIAMPIKNTILSIFYLYRIVASLIILPIILLISAAVVVTYREIKNIIKCYF